MVEYFLFELANPKHHLAAATIWARACGPGMALSPRVIEFNTRPSEGVQQVGQFAGAEGVPVGFVLASIWQGENEASPDGWVDAIAVAPEAQRQGIGQGLLGWAEDWLRAQGCRSVRAGASLRTFAPGIPVELGDDFFRGRDYLPDANGVEEWDLGRDLLDYQSPLFLRTLDVQVHPAAKRDIAALRGFLTREFPGRWRYELEQHLEDGADIGEYMMLESERGVEACCRITFEDSVRYAERFYPTPLPRPWGQVGSIGVSADRRKAGYGSALLDAALHHLQGRGVRGCIIDWTDLVRYYARFGFVKHRGYRMMSKKLD